MQNLNSQIERVNLSAGKSRNLFPWCKLCPSPLCPPPLHSVQVNKRNQRGQSGWDVSHYDQRLIANSAGGMNQVPARKTTEGHKVSLSTRPPSGFPPSGCFFWDCRPADIKFPDFSIFKECPLILMTMQWRAQCCSGQTLILTTSEHSGLQRASGERWGGRGKVQSSSKSDTTHCRTEFRDSVKLFCDMSNPLSPFVLCSLLLSSSCQFLPCCLVFLPISSVSSLWTQQH